MRREDAHARLLYAFPAVYRQAIRGWLTACLGNAANVTPEKDGSHTDVRSQVLKRIAGCNMVKRLSTSDGGQNPINLARPSLFKLPNNDQVTTPFHHQIVAEHALWWECERRRQHLVVAHIPTHTTVCAGFPPAPLTLLVPLIITLLKSGRNEYA